MTTRSSRGSYRAMVLVSCLVAGGGQVLGAAEVPQEKLIAAYRLPAGMVPPVIDGHLSDEIWQRASWRDDFVQVLPVELAAPSQRTEVAVALDNENLYIAARLYDATPDRVVARQWIQGRAYEMDDQFGVALDTFRSRRHGYFFQLNPNGIRREALVDNVALHSDWETIWQGAAVRGPDGWTAEMSIPFASLSFGPGGKEWGINFVRMIGRNAEEVAWSTRGAAIRSLAPSVAGTLTGLELPRAPSGLDLKPAVVTRSESGTPGAGLAVDLTLDAFYRPSPALTVAATLNTDFSATDVDDRIVNLTRFDVFLPEKRDFFLQDTNIFEFEGLDDNGRPFFSRRIGLDDNGRPVEITGGLKLTGRSGPLSYGLLGIRQGALEGGGKTGLAVARVQANVLAESRLGAIATHGSPGGEDASLYGLDFAYRNSGAFKGRPVSGRAWFKQSDTQGRTDHNRAWGWGVAYPSDSLNVNFTQQVIEENFRPPLGFVNRANIRQSLLRGGYRSRFGKGALRSFEPWLILNHIENLDDGLLSTRWLRVWPFVLYWHSGDVVEAWRDERTEVLQSAFEIVPGVIIPAGHYRLSGNAVSVATSRQRALAASVTLEDGSFFGGRRTAVGGDLTWRPAAKVLLAPYTEVSRISLPGGDFSARVVRLRGELALTATVAWITTAQYDNLSTVMGVHSRMRWWPRPGRTLDIVLGRNIGERAVLPGRINDTVLALKYSHTLRF
jgi:hypothetical protein